MPFWYASTAGSALAAAFGSDKTAINAVDQHLHVFTAFPPDYTRFSFFTRPPTRQPVPFETRLDTTVADRTARDQEPG